jgi:PAT family beta-lactamase induction signal transducer AmpG
MVAVVGWPLFFIATAAAALPALGLMAWLQQRGHFAPLDAARNGKP